MILHVVSLDITIVDVVEHKSILPSEGGSTTLFFFFLSVN